MSKLFSKNDRIDIKFRDAMKNVARIRLEKGLAEFKPKDLSVREMTNLLTKTEGFRLSIDELKNKPKKTK